MDLEGEKLQKDLIELIRETRIRVIGPNTSAHTSTPHGFTSNFFPLGKIPRGPRVSFMAPSGAMLVVLSDLCHNELGLQVPQLQEENRKRLQEISPPYIRMRNPVDIWPSATAHGIEFGYREGMRAVLNDPNIDAVVPVLMLTEGTGAPPLDFIVAIV